MGLSSGQFRPVRSRPKSVMGHLRDIHYCQAAGSIEGEAACGGITRDSRTSTALAELIKLIVEILDEVLRFARGEFFFCHMTAARQLLFQRIQRLNESVFQGVDAGVVAPHAVGVMHALPFDAVARQ